MLASLYVENIAIIKSISIDFSDGFTILTGETGAGKSILIDSIGLILGGKSRKELIGSFGAYSFVKALFIKLSRPIIDILKENDIQITDDEIFIERKIGKDGRTVSKINGVQVPVSLLQMLAPYLINIHGQHDHIQMLNAGIHIEFLDRFSGLDDDLKEYQTQYKKLRDIRQQLQALQKASQEREIKLNRLGFKLQEYDEVKPYVGMLDYLQQRRKILQNQNEINDFLQTISSEDERSLLALVSKAVSKVEKIAQINSRFKDILDQLSAIQDLASSVVAEGEDIASEFDSSESLNDVEDKLYALQQLLSRYGPTEEDLLLDWEQTQSEFDAVNSLEKQIAECSSEYVNQLHFVQNLASALSEKRKAGADALSSKVQAELQFLDMNGVRFEVSVENLLNDKGGNVYNNRGYDRVEFLISTNAGQTPKPLHKIASGGELSRIMLSLTNVLNRQSVGTMIFDEVDTGVSGKTAEKIGVKLREVSQQRQVICITHLAQIASMGTSHYKISKMSSDGVTETSVQLLNDDERVEEISRIIGGIDITDTIRSTAKEMLLKSN